ncbi:hypothetical protein [Micromonospora sp. URMC 103]|uniref:hypothetical protein n=1 Tax=Micromonospora sp. URMC 103 TaxID=3423406 RepID=UPI003F19BB14
MNTTTLARPGRRPGALVAPHHDPRPCVVNPPQWWDVGDDGNAAAMWLCRKRCPLADTCEPEGGSIRQGVPWGGGFYRKAPTALYVCPDCGHPRVRQGARGISVCKCPARTQAVAE